MDRYCRSGCRWLLEIFLWFWVLGTALFAVLIGVGCYFIDTNYLKTHLYTSKPDEATPLLSRTFAFWMFLAAVVKFSYLLPSRCHRKSLFIVTLCPFLLESIHILLEIFYFKTIAFGYIFLMIVPGCWMIGICISEYLQSKDQNKVIGTE